VSSQQPTVLVIGATGQTGRLIVEDLKRDPDNVQLRLAVHKQANVERLKSAGNEAVHLDLDDVKTFGPALAGVDRLYLLTGYTVAMLHQSKTLVDAAKKACVQHIVHQGIFGEWDYTDPHFAWHQMIETYIKGSGLAWTPVLSSQGAALQPGTQFGSTILGASPQSPQRHFGFPIGGAHAFGRVDLYRLLGNYGGSVVEMGATRLSAYAL
jgi:hypothetical protein